MFRIWLYLKFSNFLRSLFENKQIEKRRKLIEYNILKQSNKKYAALFSQCRVAFFFILKFLRKKYDKKEIIFCAYNLPEMINIAKNLNLNIKFCDINNKTGLIDYKQLKKKLSNKTIAVVLTNMFNDYKDSQKIKELVKKNKTILIEDNAIYFDNFTKLRNKNIFSGNLGDFSIYSFNIMKNISSFFGGAASTNNKEFIEYYKKENKKLDEFFSLPLIKQISIFVILKLMSINFLYKIFFIHIIQYSYYKNIKSILQLFYPSLRSINKKFPKYYFSRISELSVNATYYQIKDKVRRQRIFNSRKIKHKYYFKKLLKIKNKKFDLLHIKDVNYQNFLDFPILVKNKDKLNRFLLDKGIEIRFKHYYNCEKLFKNKKTCINAERYEKQLICLPVHPKIQLTDMDFVVKNIEVFCSKR